MVLGHMDHNDEIGINPSQGESVAAPVESFDTSTNEQVEGASATTSNPSKKRGERGARTARSVGAESTGARPVEVVPAEFTLGQVATEPASSEPAFSEPASSEPAAPISCDHLPPIFDRVEAILLSTDRPLPVERIAIALGLVLDEPSLIHASSPASSAPGSTAQELSFDSEQPATLKPKSKRVKASKPRAPIGDALARVRDAVDLLNAAYERDGRSFRIEPVAGGYRVMTLSKYAPDVARLRNAKVSAKLSRASVETLAIIAYKQPITRAELEAIRGVSCGEVLKSLLERRLVTIKGRAEELGRPMLYGTTREFLDHFGLPSIKDLPTVEELRATGV